ncbi:hypothetical protein EVAR_25458_1 [Eumeta japonica]|uniref:Uncharacterized protein n=1 Tax=Eumeta variegata TaxID=151549 RepID=A0A4C1VPE6_EUMVA|nr:hypothetical protein EVAR_25458_1 [Eumeta japonica]
METRATQYPRARAQRRRRGRRAALRVRRALLSGTLVCRIPNDLFYRRSDRAAAAFLFPEPFVRTICFLTSAQESRGTNIVGRRVQAFCVRRRGTSLGGATGGLLSTRPFVFVTCYFDQMGIIADKSVSSPALRRSRVARAEMRPRHRRYVRPGRRPGPAEGALRSARAV